MHFPITKFSRSVLRGLTIIHIIILIYIYIFKLNLNYILYINLSLESGHIIFSLNDKIYSSIDKYNQNNYLLIITITIKFHF